MVQTIRDYSDYELAEELESWSETAEPRLSDVPPLMMVAAKRLRERGQIGPSPLECIRQELKDKSKEARRKYNANGTPYQIGKHEAFKEAIESIEAYQTDFSDHHDVLRYILELPCSALDFLGLRGIDKHREVVEAYLDRKPIQKKFSNGEWLDVECPDFKNSDEYRIKPQTQIINGFEVPLSIQKEPSKCTGVWAEDPLSPAWVRFILYDTTIKGWFEKGLLHYEKENAVICAKARLGIDPYSEDE